MKRIVTIAIAAAFCITPLGAATRTAILRVPGMTCPTCPITVKKALQRTPGVSKIDVDFHRKKVTVTFDDAKTNEKALVKATTDVGFPSQPDPADPSATLPMK